MNIEIKSVKDVGFCNFCQRERVDVPSDSDCWRWRRPYTHVYEVRGNTIGFRMCGHCRKEFIDKMLRLPLTQDHEERRSDCA